MQAILLAAGIGRRMGPDAPPKCLLMVGGKTILARTFEALRSVGVGRVVLVVGYRKEEVIAEARRSAGALALTFIENSRYLEGAILSLWSAREALSDDVLILDADVLTPAAAFERLVGSAHPNCLLVDSSSADTGEEQMVLGVANRALSITKRPSQELAARLTTFGESVGFLKLARPAAGVLRELLKEKVQAGEVLIEHEQVYPHLFEKVPVGLERIDGLAWTEIDTPEDLARAEKEILPQWEGEDCLNRRFSKLFLPLILPLPVSPNGWTALSFLSGLASLGFIASGSAAGARVGACFFQLFYVIDNWDGAVARAKGLSSKWGGWFDVTVDAVVHTLLPLALALGLQRPGGPAWIFAAAGTAAFGIGMDFVVTLRAKARGFGPAIFGDPLRCSRSRGSALGRLVKANLTNENLSLLVAAALLARWELPLLLAMAVGSHLFWIQFFWKNRSRLAAYSLAQARR